MRISDWSSDVCSSDLAGLRLAGGRRDGQGQEAAGAGIEGEAADAQAAAAVARQAQAQVRVVQRELHLAVETLVGQRLAQGGLDLLGGDLLARAPEGDPLVAGARLPRELVGRSEEHTSELQSLMRISDAVFCLKK